MLITDVLDAFERALKKREEYAAHRAEADAKNAYEYDWRISGAVREAENELEKTLSAYIELKADERIIAMRRERDEE